MTDTFFWPDFSDHTKARCLEYGLAVWFRDIFFVKKEKVISMFSVPTCVL